MSTATVSTVVEAIKTVSDAYERARVNVSAAASDATSVRDQSAPATPTAGKVG
jgi:hypothetical protein